MSCRLLVLMLFGLTTHVSAAPLSARRPPIIDMHLHANSADSMGPPPVVICDGYEFWPTRDPSKPDEEYARKFMKEPGCARPLLSAKDDQTLMQESLAMLERHNVYAVTSGSADRVRRWRAASPSRVIPALGWDLHPSSPKLLELRKLFASKEFVVFGEIGNQYLGIAPNDPRFDPYLAMAEELDVPVAIHIGPGPPGTPYIAADTRNYRASLHSPLLLEDVLRKHPKLRLYAMHAGWPMLDQMIAMLYTYPQLHVDVGVLSYAFAADEYYRYLQALVRAGFGKRILFGSDQMVWPQAIEIAIRRTEQAPFLSDAQKRDIMYYNAARFLRLSDEEIRRHHAPGPGPQ